MSNTDTFQITENYPTPNFLLVPGPNPQLYTVFIFKYSDWITGKQQTLYAIAQSVVNSDGTWKGVLDPILQTYSPILLPETESNGTDVGSYTIVAIKSKAPSSTIVLALQVTAPLATPYILPVALGGTGTAIPSLVGGVNVTIAGTWPDQTISSTGGGGGGSAGGGVDAQTGNYLATAGDNGKLISISSSSPATLTLPATPPSPTWFIAVEDVGPAGLTVNPNGLLLDGLSASLGLSPGSSGTYANFFFTQSVAATVWTINHNLGRYPAVTVMDTTHRQVFAQVDFGSTNQVTVTFNAAESGTVSCS